MHGGENRMKIFLFLILFVVVCSFVVLSEEEELPIVYSPELNTLNYIEGIEGQTIGISTRILLGPETIDDATCGIEVDNAGNGDVMLPDTNMEYDLDNQRYAYDWTLTESWWEQVIHFFVPSIGFYLVNITCESGTLDTTVLNDIVLLRVVSP